VLSRSSRPPTARPVSRPGAPRLVSASPLDVKQLALPVRPVPHPDSLSLSESFTRWAQSERHARQADPLLTADPSPVASFLRDIANRGGDGSGDTLGTVLVAGDVEVPTQRVDASPLDLEHEGLQRRRVAFGKRDGHVEECLPHQLEGHLGGVDGFVGVEVGQADHLSKYRGRDPLCTADDTQAAIVQARDIERRSERRERTALLAATTVLVTLTGLGIVAAALALGVL